MIGITAYGVYIPLWRIRRDLLSAGKKGEKAVASFDEDSLTMAVAAADNCLADRDRQSIDGLFFASTTSPYKEKLVSTIIAAALDLPKEILTADFTSSLRAGTIAMKSALDSVKAGSAKQILVVVADCRLGAPGSDFETNCGDGAAAFIIGDQKIVAGIEGYYSRFSEIMDIWRAEGDQFIRSGEERFVQSQGYQKAVPRGPLRVNEATEPDFPGFRQGHYEWNHGSKTAGRLPGRWLRSQDPGTGWPVRHHRKYWGGAHAYAAGLRS